MPRFASAAVVQSDNCPLYQQRTLESMDRLFKESPLIVPFSNYDWKQGIRGDTESALEQPSTPVDEKNELKGELSHEETHDVNRLH